MAGDPKKALETALFALLDGWPTMTWPVYNTEGTGTTFEYVVFQAVGGEDDHMKKRGYLYSYQVVGIHTNRATAEDMSAAIEACLATATRSGALSVAGHAIIWAERTQAIDVPQPLSDGRMVHHVGGTYEFMLREV